MGKVSLLILKELEHQARQNISTLNFATTFAKTSSCNATLEKCQYSLKSTSQNLKFVNVPILRKQQSVDTKKPVNTWIFGTRLFLFNTEP